MKQLVNEVYKPLFTKTPRYFILLGGRGAGRSTVASQFANAKLIAPEYFRCAIMRYILSDIRNSIYREILDRAEENEIYNQLKINDSTMVIEYGQNSINAVGFRKSSSDQKSKLKSLASYNCVIIEEADEIPEEDFMQLDDSLRTIKGDINIILLLNPPAKNHWVIKRWFDLMPSDEKDFYIPKAKENLTDTIILNTDYHVNQKNLAIASIVQYEKYKETKPTHYWNMIRGLVPETVKGKIYKNWAVINSIPHEAKLVRYGLDFGYSNDPTSIVAIYRYNGGFILDEITYKIELSNKDISDILKNIPKALVVADSSEPKSIDEIYGYDVNIIGANKGAGSVNQGIQYVQDQRVSVTSRSKNIIKEYDNYAWIVNKDGDTVNEPSPNFNHAMDAIRYGMESLKPQEDDIISLPDDTRWVNKI
jgi:phage terminase large subunit